MKYNKADYENAYSVIKKCKDYVKNELGDIMNNSDFPNFYKLLLLKTTPHYYSRGSARTYLSISCNGLFTFDECDDGTKWTHAITLPKDMSPYTYAYNNSEQRTIDLALKLVQNWDSIKSRITAIKTDYESTAKRNADLLANFEV